MNKTPLFPNSSLGLREFTALMASLTALGALAVDAVMPAFLDMSRDLNLQNANDIQLVIGLLFFGTTVGHLFYGPIADAYGRKPALFLGISLFLVGCVITITVNNFHYLLAGRFLQGLGTASSRIVTTAIIRDRFKGREMARVMSLIMTVFILVPILAPSLGQLVLFIASWRWIFIMFFILGILNLLWFTKRQPETLREEYKKNLSLGDFKFAIKAVITHRQSLGYTLIAGLIFGSLLGYLHSAQQILQVQFELGTKFTLYFGLLAVSIGVASFSNSKLVLRFGTKKLVSLGLFSSFGYALLFLLYYFLIDKDSFWVFYIYLLFLFFSLGILFGNLNAMAMEPHGKIAGSASTIIGTTQSMLSLFFGVLIGRSYNGTVLPLALAFAGLTLLSILVFLWTNRK